MLSYAQHKGERTPKRGGFRRHKLTDATAYIGYKWSGVAHRALGDAMACRAVWNWTNRTSAQPSQSQEAVSARAERERTERERQMRVMQQERDRLASVQVQERRKLAALEVASWRPPEFPSQAQPDRSSGSEEDIARPRTGAVAFALVVILPLVGFAVVLCQPLSPPATNSPLPSKSEASGGTPSPTAAGGPSNPSPRTADTWATVASGSRLAPTQDGYIWRSGARIGWADQNALIYYRLDQIEMFRASPVPKAGAVGEKFSIGGLQAAVDRAEKEHGSPVYQDTIEYDAVVRTNDGFVWSPGRQIGFVKSSTFYRLDQIDASTGASPKLRPGATGVEIVGGNLSDAVRRAYTEGKK
jgi:hypothetical protein